MLTSMYMMPGQLLLWPRLPFFCNLINTPLLHSSSTFSSFHIQLQKPTRTSSDTSSLALITSGVYCHNMVPFHSHTVSFLVAFLISELVYGAMSTHYLCSASVVCTNLSIHVFHFILNSHPCMASSQAQPSALHKSDPLPHLLGHNDRGPSSWSWEVIRIVHVLIDGINNSK